MDLIVSVAILNDPELEEELRGENLPGTSETDLLQNRRIVWQYPAPGTPLTPPYLILIAVEHQDIAQAQKVVESIMGELVTNPARFRLPKTAVQKLR